jgi:hypothetical protein
VCFFKHKRDTTPRPFHTSWAKLKAHLLRPPDERNDKDGPLWSPARYRHGHAYRLGKNVEVVTALALDIDGDDLPLDRLVGLEYVAHTTYSHKLIDPKHNPHGDGRWRLVIPLTREVAAHDWRDVHVRARAHFGSSTDRKCKDPSRIYFLPSCPPGHHGDWTVSIGDGRALDPDELLDVPTAAHPRQAQTPHERKPPVDLAARLVEPVRKGNRHVALRDLANHYARHAVEINFAAHELVSFATTRCDPPVPAEDVLRLVYDAYAYIGATDNPYGDLSPIEYERLRDAVERNRTFSAAHKTIAIDLIRFCQQPDSPPPYHWLRERHGRKTSSAIGTCIRKLANAGLFLRRVHTRKLQPGEPGYVEGMDCWRKTVTVTPLFSGGLRGGLLALANANDHESQRGGARHGAGRKVQKRTGATIPFSEHAFDFSWSARNGVSASPTTPLSLALKDQSNTHSENSSAPRLRISSSAADNTTNDPWLNGSIVTEHHFPPRGSAPW